MRARRGGEPGPGGKGAHGRSCHGDATGQWVWGDMVSPPKAWRSWVERAGLPLHERRPDLEHEAGRGTDLNPLTGLASVGMEGGGGRGQECAGAWLCLLGEKPKLSGHPRPACLEQLVD